MTDAPSDATHYRNFTRILVQQIYESVVSGSVFVDLADHVSRGHRLFNWAAETDKVVNSIRASHSYGTGVPIPFRRQLETLDEIIVDEHPHLLGTLFIIWKNTSQIDDGNASGRYSINTVTELCQQLLGHQHLIMEIFVCLMTGSFEPTACLERLEVLPSELFAPKDQALEPSFDKYGTSDYHTMSSLYAASEGSSARAQGLELMNSEAVSLRALALRRYSKERHRENLRPAPRTYPWETSPQVTQAVADPEEPFTTNLTDPRSPTSFATRPIGINSYPLGIGRDSQSSMGSPHVLSTEDSWPMGKLEGSSTSFSEQTRQPEESHSGKTLEVLDASTPSLPRTPSTPTPNNGDMQMDMDEGSVSHDEESDSWSSSTADEQQCMRGHGRQKGASHLEDITGNSLSIKKKDTGEPTQAPSQAEGSTKREQSKKSRKRPKVSGKGEHGGRRKGTARAGDKDEGNESDEGEDGNERSRKVPDRPGEPKGMLLACPFFKWNPLRYQRKKECAGPGWPTVHHLKLAPQSRSALRDQQRSEPQRRVQIWTPDIEGRLKVRPSSKQTDVEKWKQVYNILFDTSTDYDHDISALDREETWKEYARREIVILLRQRIEAEVERRFAGVAPELIAGLMDIVHDLELILRRNFERRQEEARNLDREETPGIPPPVPDESSINTAQTPGNDEGQTTVVPGNNSFLIGSLPLDGPQQEVLPFWPTEPEASAVGMAKGEQPLDSSLLDNIDFDFLNYDEGNDTL
ncbi:hypothetical protein CSAL01_10533 [Colletotrichum salicis]|uniref:Uncharacterized protein n=1 Tax=Colletotrichum salicis TaxID=1209931 RepID=A0A135VAG7_9PEZI|nr:hypothetical protein CSAL01_10533 [Colletotrichum salicis]